MGAIAAVMDTSEDAVKALLKRARGELRDCVESKLRRSP
jgi:DNA-directed RNA polymerase specialized sigma24 family protein